jgi:hypothetical protein
MKLRFDAASVDSENTWVVTEIYTDSYLFQSFHHNPGMNSRAMGLEISI